MSIETLFAEYNNSVGEPVTEEESGDPMLLIIIIAASIVIVLIVVVVIIVIIKKKKKKADPSEKYKVQEVDESLEPKKPASSSEQLKDEEKNKENQSSGREGDEKTSNITGLSVSVNEGPAESENLKKQEANPEDSILESEGIAANIESGRKK